MSALTFRAPVSSPAVRWRPWRFIGIALVAPAFIASASAQPQQTYPNRPIRFVVALAAGAGTDVAARLFAQKLTDAFGQQVVVDNRPGASGMIATDLVAKASPDGYTLITATTIQTSLPALRKNLPYDIIKDFAPVSLLIDYPLLLVVHPSVPAKSVKELIALAKARPGQINYGSSGAGSAAHLNSELFKSETRINLVHVPYKSIANAVIGTIAGENTLGFYSVSTILTHVKTGKLRALATTGAKRSPSVPDLPTIAEAAGVPGYDVMSWVGVLVPAGTPKSIITKLHGEFTRVLRLPDVKERLASLDFESVGSTPEEFATYMKKELATWARVMKESGIKAD